MSKKIVGATISFGDIVNTGPPSNASSFASVCVLCGGTIVQHSAYHQLACRHRLHDACYVELLQVHRNTCVKCFPASNHTSPVSVTSGQQARLQLDTGVDPAIRRQAHLQLQSFQSKLPAIDNDVVYWSHDYGSVPRAPGGPVPSTLQDHVVNTIKSAWKTWSTAATRTIRSATNHNTEVADTTLDDQNDKPTPVTDQPPCTRATCGGPRFCMHRFLPDNVDMRLVQDWQRFDLPFPAPTSTYSTLYAQRVVSAHFRHHTDPVDWARCGLTPQAFALAGVTLQHLVTYEKYHLGTVLSHMKADWCTLQALHFHPTLLHNGYVYPIVTLAKHGLNASTLCEFPITYQMLAKTLQLTPYELCALGFTSRQLMAIGMTGRDVLDLMTQTSGFTKGWLAKAFGFTKTQVARFNLTELEFKVYANAKMHMQQLYATAQ